MWAGSTWAELATVNVSLMVDAANPLKPKSPHQNTTESEGPRSLESTMREPHTGDARLTRPAARSAQETVFQTSISMAQPGRKIGGQHCPIGARSAQKGKCTYTD